MPEVTETIYFFKFFPLLPAFLFWIYYFYSRHTCNRYETMKRLKQWHDLPRYSATESKEDTLNDIIKTENNRVIVSFRFAVMFSLMALFCLFYMR